MPATSLLTPKNDLNPRQRAAFGTPRLPLITLIIGPHKPVFYSEDLPGLPGSCGDSDEFVDGPDRLLGASALGGPPCSSSAATSSSSLRVSRRPCPARPAAHGRSDAGQSR